MDSCRFDAYGFYSCAGDELAAAQALVKVLKAKMPWTQSKQNLLDYLSKHTDESFLNANNPDNNMFTRGTWEVEAFLSELAKAGIDVGVPEQGWDTILTGLPFLAWGAKGAAGARAVVGGGKAVRSLLKPLRNERGAMSFCKAIGKWEEVGRSKAGLEFQSKMSGNPIIRTKDGKLRIKEYKVNGVYFDDYKNGKLIDYKDEYSQFIKDGKFAHWFKGEAGMKKQAFRQVQAAKGAPVEWHVHKNHVNAFKSALRGIKGIKIVGVK